MHITNYILEWTLAKKKICFSSAYDTEIPVYQTYTVRSYTPRDETIQIALKLLTAAQNNLTNAFMYTMQSRFWLTTSYSIKFLDHCVISDIKLIQEKKLVSY